MQTEKLKINKHRTTQDAMRDAHQLRENLNNPEATLCLNPHQLAQDTVLLLEEVYRLQKRVNRMRNDND